MIMYSTELEEYLLWEGVGISIEETLRMMELL